MADSLPDTPGESPRRWQYSIKSLLIVTTGVGVWAKMAVVLNNVCDGPYWFKGVFALWLGALLAQGALGIWAWRQIHRREDSEGISGRFRRSVAWGLVPFSQWLLVCIIMGIGHVRMTMTTDGYMAFMGVTILHMSLPTALLLIGSAMRDNDVYPVRVMRWSVVVSCLVPLLGVVLAWIVR